MGEQVTPAGAIGADGAEMAASCGGSLLLVWAGWLTVRSRVSRTCLLWSRCGYGGRGLPGGALCCMVGHGVVEVGEFVGVVAGPDCEPCVRWCQESGVFCTQAVGTPTADRSEKPAGRICPHAGDYPRGLPRKSG